MQLPATASLFVVTAIAEIVGCYLPYLWLRQGRSPLLLVPAALSLAVFAWLLTLHPTAAGRVYAAYGGVYVSVAAKDNSAFSRCSPRNALTRKQTWLTCRRFSNSTQTASQLKGCC
ncbi:MAG: YnfA family protein [Pirellulales bacterium]